MEDDELTDVEDQLSDDELSDEELYEDLDTYLKEKFNSQLLISPQAQLPRTECSRSNLLIYPNIRTSPTYLTPFLSEKSKSISLRQSTTSLPPLLKAKYLKSLHASTKTLPQYSLE